ncbi:MAG: TonB-dependent receptor [Pseudomonadota bacterium]
MLPVTTWADESRPVDVPAQELPAAIAELGKETGLQISAPASAVEGVVSRSVSGPMEPVAALREMLGGTGLRVLQISDNSVVVSQNVSDVSFDLGILVLGELLERDLQETQSSVVVVTGENLDERGETSVGQTLDRIPGVSTSQGLVIRGIADDGGLGSGTTASTISVTTDGIRLSDYRNFGRSNISTWDVEQVEVFRGSQSTQAGRNALAGAIVVEGAKPKFVPEYRLRFGLLDGEGLDDSGPGLQTAFVLNTPIIEDRLAARLSVDLRDTDGEGGPNNKTIRAGLLYEPTDRLSFGLTHTDIDNADGLQQIQSPRLTVDYAINDALTFTSRTQYTEAQTEFDQFIFGRSRDYETVDQEFRLIYETDRMRAVGGVFYTSIDEVSLLFSTPSTPPPLTGVQTEDIDTQNYAIYGEVEYDVSPQWTVIAGLRYDVEDVDNTTELNGLVSGVIPITGGGSLDTTYDALLPKLGVVYNFEENQSLGLTYQRGYRAGGLSISVPITGGTATTFEFDPDFTDTYELAYRSQSSDGTRTLNANLFYTTWTDQQVSTLNSLNLPVIDNVADSDLWGAEIDYSQTVNSNLEVFASAAVVKTEYGSFLDVNGNQIDGNSFSLAPELVGSFGANYTFDNGLSIGGDINYTSSSFSDTANTPALENDDYWVTNVNVNYIFDNGAVLTAYARNLFDEVYTIQRNTVSDFTIFGKRREYGVFVTMEF